MRLAVLNEKIIGKKLEMPIYSWNGIVIMNKGAVFTQRNITRLKNMGIYTAYIESEDDEIILQEAIEASIRLKLLNALHKIFTDVKKKGVLADEYAVRDIAKEIIENINIAENSLLLFNNISRNEKDMKLPIHSLNVAIVATVVGIQMGYSYEKLIDLTLGALMHDIGKLFDEGENHTKIGFAFMKKHRAFSAMSNICVYAHHKNYDNSGYPDNVDGKEVHEFAKIVNICNEYDHLLNDSGKAMLPHEALERIMADTGKKFDFEIYKVFVKSIYCYPNGLPVRLNNKQEGIVIMQNKGWPQRPIVKVRHNDKTYVYNLMENLTLFIEEVII